MVLSADIALPELTPAGAVVADWTFGMSDGRLAPAPAAWFHSWRALNGRRVASFGRCTRGYHLRFHGKADFLIDRGARSIVCWRRRAVTLTTVRHLLLDQVMPLVLSGDSRLVLHAAAVVTPRGAIAFAGPSGSGKSTLATAVAALGFPLLCDDCLVVKPGKHGFLAGPFYPGARLYPDSVRALGMTGLPSLRVAAYTRKRRIAMSPLLQPGASTPLAYVFVLDGRAPHRAVETLALTRFSRRDALVALAACTFHLDIGDAAAVRGGFELQSRLVRSTPVSRLHHPWRLSRLDETRDAILQCLNLVPALR